MNQKQSWEEETTPTGVALIELLKKQGINTLSDNGVELFLEISKFVQQAIQTRERELFNTEETKKDWQETFYESDWEPDTLNKTEIESAISSELSSFLPRHMEVYDWNLPYIDYIILVVRKHVLSSIINNK